MRALVGPVLSHLRVGSPQVPPEPNLVNGLHPTDFAPRAVVLKERILLHQVRRSKLTTLRQVCLYYRYRIPQFGDVSQPFVPEIGRTVFTGPIADQGFRPELVAITGERSEVDCIAAYEMPFTRGPQLRLAALALRGGAENARA